MRSGLEERYSEVGCRGAKAPITRPQRRPGDARRAEQVNIDRAEPAAPETFVIDEVDELLAAQRRQPGEATEGRGYLIAGGEGTQCQLRDDAVVRRSTVVEKQSAEGGLQPVQVIYPHTEVSTRIMPSSRGGAAPRSRTGPCRPRPPVGARSPLARASRVPIGTA